ncbi:MAG: hypothetical protein CTY20_05985 [Hyphomicrobium sp.]|nr:MAG: hypothetical protein CTY20_05985 [Hyphomicrobium sp.]
MQQRPLQRLMPERQLLAVDDSDAGRAGEGEQDGCSGAPEPHVRRSEAAPLGRKMNDCRNRPCMRLSE